MKYITEYRNPQLVAHLVDKIKQIINPDRTYRIMEFCGGHTHALFRFGLPNLLPPQIEMIHGPGCPVCIMPTKQIDLAIYLSQQPKVILCTYADMMRVPGSQAKSLLQAKAMGGAVKMILSPSETLKIAEINPAHHVIFFAIGFETTTPPTAATIQQAAQQKLSNFSVFCNHVLTPAAIQRVLSAPESRTHAVARIDGFLGPAHVSTIIGTKPYAYFAQEFKKPVVISGFEPADMLQSIFLLVQQINKSQYKVENEYARAVTVEGNQKAQHLVAEVFELRKSFEWRGLGEIPYSALKIKPRYSEFDTEIRYNLPVLKSRENKACQCGLIIRGLKKPTDCKLFAHSCTPDHPMGSCMVSSEGSCAAYYNYHSIPLN